MIVSKTYKSIYLKPYTIDCFLNGSVIDFYIQDNIHCNKLHQASTDTIDFSDDKALLDFIQDNHKDWIQSYKLCLTLNEQHYKPLIPDINSPVQ